MKSKAPKSAPYPQYRRSTIRIVSSVFLRRGLLPDDTASVDISIIFLINAG